MFHLVMLMSDMRTLLVGKGENLSDSSSSDPWSEWQAGFLGTDLSVVLVLGENELKNKIRLKF